MIRLYTEGRFRRSGAVETTDAFYRNLNTRVVVTNNKDEDGELSYTTKKENVIGVIEDSFGWDWIVFDAEQKGVVITDRNAGLAFRITREFVDKETAETWLDEQLGKTILVEIEDYWI